MMPWRRRRVVEEQAPPVAAEPDDPEVRRVPLAGRPQFHLALLAIAIILWLWALQTTDVGDIVVGTADWFTTVDRTRTAARSDETCGVLTKVPHWSRWTGSVTISRTCR